MGFYVYSSITSINKDTLDGSESKAFGTYTIPEEWSENASLSTAANIYGDGTNTKNGYILYIFTIEEESGNITTKQYYIVGDYKYVLVIETDFHDKDIPDVSETARTIVESFEWKE